MLIRVIGVALAMMTAGPVLAQEPDAATGTTPAKTPAELRLEALKIERDSILAQQEIASARGGIIPDPPKGGTTTTEAGAGEPEAMILAARQIRTAAVQIVSALSTWGAKPIFVTSDSAFPSIQERQIFDIRYKALSDQLTEAAAISTRIMAVGGSSPRNRYLDSLSRQQHNLFSSQEMAAFPGGVATAAQLATSVLSWFATDYTIEGVEVADVDTNDLVSAVLWAGAGRIKTLDAGPLSTDVITGMETRLTALQTKRTALEPARQRCLAWDAEAAAAIEAAPADSKAAARARFAERLNLCGTMTPAIASYDAFGTTYGSAGDDKLLKVMQQMELEKRLGRDGQILMVSTSGVTGASYTQSNIVSTLGGMPFHVTTTSEVVWQLRDRAGEYLDGDVITAYSGYQRLPDIDTLVNGCNAVNQRRQRSPGGQAACPTPALARPEWVMAVRRPVPESALATEGATGSIP